MGDRLQYYLPERGTCVLCNMGIIETSNHLFWECHFTKTVWRPIIEAWTNTFNRIPQWENVIIPSSIQIDTQSHQQPLEYLQYAKQLWAILQVTISYTIWRARNDIVFNAHQSKPTPDTVRRWSLKCLWPQLYLWMDQQKNAPQSIFLKQFIQANAVFRVWWCNGYNLDKWIDSLLVVKTPHMPITCTQECRMQFDGGSLHNPGVAGSGWTIDIPAVDGELREYAWGYCYLGNNHSNNEAEYVALVSGLTAAAYLGYPIPLNRRWQSINLESISKHVMQSGQILPLLQNLGIPILHTMKEVHINHIWREHNQCADDLSKLTMHTQTNNVSTTLQNYTHIELFSPIVDIHRDR